MYISIIKIRDFYILITSIIKVFIPKLGNYNNKSLL